MKQARYTIFTITSTIPGLGVYGVEADRETPTFVVDVGFSVSLQPGGMLAARLFAPSEDWSMSTGTSLPLIPDAMDQFLAAGQDFLAETGRTPSPSEEHAMLIRACIETGAAESVRHLSLEEIAAMQSRKPRSRPSRRHTRRK
jgi:hypothetical protein